MAMRSWIPGVLCGLVWSAPAPGVPQGAVDDGVFFEAENHDKLLPGEGVGVPLAERGRSGDKVLLGMGRDGAEKAEHLSCFPHGMPRRDRGNVQ